MTVHKEILLMEGFRCSEQRLSCHYNYQREVEAELIASLPEKIATTTQSGKVVRTAAGLLRLNLLQAALLGWLLRRSNYTLSNLSSSASAISLFEEDLNKELLLLILLNAYYVKSHLAKEVPQVQADVLSMVPQFSRVYRSWRPDCLLKDADLSQINLTFQAWTLPPRRPRPDYNQFVNKILELSKTYNTAATDEEQQQPRKKRKGNETSPKPSPKPSPRPREVIQESDAEEEEHSPRRRRSPVMLRSSRIDHNLFQEEMFGLEEENDNNGDLLRRSTRMRRSTAFPNFDLEHSRGPGLGTLLLGQSMARTNSRGMFGTEDRPSPFGTRIRQTSSFDRMNE